MIRNTRGVIMIPAFFITVLFGLLAVGLFGIGLAIVKEFILSNLAIVATSIISLLLAWTLIRRGLDPEIFEASKIPLLAGIGALVFFVSFSALAPRYFSVVLPMTIGATGPSIEFGFIGWMILGLIIAIIGIFYLESKGVIKK